MRQVPHVAEVKQGPAEPAEAAPTAAGRPLMRGWLHAGALVAVLIAGPLLVSDAQNARVAAVLAIYVASIAALFGVSAAFHRIKWSPRARRLMRRADHGTIFVGIAGTYTAVAGICLAGWTRGLVLALVWAGAVVGIVLRQVWLDAPKWAIALPYVVVGWSALAVVPQLVHFMGGTGFGLLLAGGVAYTAGAIVYARRRPDPFPSVFGYHEIFHACTVVGATLQFVAIAVFALPRA
jgi:hemolysin III